MYAATSNNRRYSLVAHESAPDVIALLGKLYEGLHPDVSWETTLAELASGFACDAVMLLCLDPETQQVHHAWAYGLPASVINDYLCHYASEDPLVNQVSALPGAVLTDDLEDSTDRDSFRTWVKLATGQRYRGSLVVQVDDARAVCLLLFRSEIRGAPSPGWIDSLQQLGPHLCRLLRLRRAREENDSRLRVWRTTADQTALAIFTLDFDGVLQENNAAAGELLVDGDGLWVEDAKLAVRMAGDKAAFAEALRRVSDGQKGVALPIHRRSGKTAYHLILSPVDHENRSSGTTFSTIVAYVSDPKRPCAVSGAHLNRVYGLSKREAQLQCH